MNMQILSMSVGLLQHQGKRR